MHLEKTVMVRLSFPRVKFKVRYSSWIESTPTIAPSASSFVQTPTLAESESEQLDALVLFDFTPTSEFELGVHGIVVPTSSSVRRYETLLR